jgi:hypothetical protein
VHERDVDAECLERGGDLHADEPGADDDRPCRAIGRLADPGRVGDRAQGEDARQLAPGHVELLRGGPARDQELLVADPLAAGELDLGAGRVDVHDLGLQRDLDLVLVVEPRLLDEDLLLLLLPAQVALGEGWAVVRNLRVHRDEPDAALAAALAVGLDGAWRRQAAPDDHKRVLCHESPQGRYRLLRR